MTLAGDGFVIRPATSTDLAAIGHVSHQTGLLGEPIADFFPDEALWADAFVRPFLEAGCCNFVAEQQGRVVGYIIGSCEPKSFERYLKKRLPWLILSHWLRGAYPRWWRDLGYLWRAWKTRGGSAPWQHYPAQLHVNLLPEARGKGLGSRLLQTFLTCLQEKGVRGVQLGTTERNQAALRLYQRYGFRVFSNERSPFWLPVVGEELHHIRLVKELPRR
ncbi:N-acetyltransferase family protein [Oceanithermus sp.]